MRPSFLTFGLALCAAGCVPPPRELRAPVEHLVDQRIELSPGVQHGIHPGTPLTPATAAQIDALLAQPVDPAVAIQIALANSPRLRAAFDELDIAAGDVAAALGLGPVTVDAKLRYGGAHNEYELDAVQSVLGLLAAPGRLAAAHAELAATRARAAAIALRLAARTEIAFNDLLAAEQAAAVRQTAFEAADAAATLRERMHTAGNTTDLALARDRDAREQARLELGRAKAEIVARRETVTALLGVSGVRTSWTATGALPPLAAAPPALDGLEAIALSGSLELAAGRQRRAAAEHRATGEILRTVLPELGVGVAIASDGHDTGIGPALRIGIPLFDPRSGERARARALVRREDHELAAQAAELGAAARAARSAALATYEEARQLRDVVLPLRQQIVDETLKHYNAMDADLFTLIAARRELVSASHQYLDALRRHADAMVEVTALLRGVMLEPATGSSPTRNQDTP
jgi:outer membrane protein TolC